MAHSKKNEGKSKAFKTIHAGKPIKKSKPKGLVTKKSK